MPWQVDKETELFVSASSRPSRFGTTIYNELFRRFDINAVYLSRSVIDSGSLASSIRTLDVRGCSVSMPLKGQIIKHLDVLDPEAERVRSVNTVLHRDARLIGHNTDIHGLRETLRELSFERVLVYGSGSVVDSILSVLDGREVFLTARDPAKSRAIARRWDVAEYRQQPIELFINATPMSLEPIRPEVMDLLAPTVFDLVVPRENNFLETVSRERGLRYVPGFVMYQHQFAKQFELYTGKQIEPRTVESVAKERGLI